MTRSPRSRKLGLALGSLLFSLLVIELCLRLAGAVLAAGNSARNNPGRERLFSPNTVRILCLGPCYTQGFGAPPEHTYPRRLGRLLEERFPGIDFAVVNRGIGGENLSFFVNNLEGLLGKFRPHLVVLNINDRVDFFDENILLANLELFSRLDRLRLSAISLLNRSKAYRLMALLLKPERVVTGVQQARLSRLKGITDRREAGIEQLRSQLSQSPKDSRSWYHLSVAYYEQGVPGPALQNIKKAIALEPGNGEYYLHLFKCHAMSGEYGPALDASRKGLAADPVQKERILSMISGLEEHLRLVPWDAPKYIELTLLHAYLGHFDESLRLCEKAMAEDLSQNRMFNIADFNRGMLRHQGRKVSTAGPSVDRSLYFTKTKNSPWVFLNSMRAFLGARKLRVDKSLLDGPAIFTRLLRYDLSKARDITKRHGTAFILENMGSTVEQQESIKRVCSEMDVPLVDVFQALKDRPDRDALFHDSLSQTLNKEGYNFLAEEILQGILKNNLLDKGFAHAKRP